MQMIVELGLTNPVSAPAVPSTNGSGGLRFGEMVAQKLREVNQLNLRAEALTEAFAAGKDVEVHQVMLAAEEARLAMDFTIQVRNRLIDGYQELMRMQM